MKTPTPDIQTADQPDMLAGLYNKRAWTPYLQTLSHLLIKSGSRVAVMDAGLEPDIGEAFATARSHHQFIACDSDPDFIAQAEQSTRMKNLRFKQMRSDFPDFAHEDVQAIVNMRNIHRLYSMSGYNRSHVVDILKRQINALPTYGVMVIRDYARPYTDETVTLELTKSDDIKKLKSFSQSARPLDLPHSQGFMIDPLDTPKSGSQRFRLPLKWAIEFIRRLDSNESWEKNLPVEYTAFTMNGIWEILSELGMRVYYAHPLWDNKRIKSVYKKRVKLLDDKNREIPFPESEYIIVAQKVGPEDPVILKERRHSTAAKEAMNLRLMEDQQTKERFPELTLKSTVDDLLPWRINSYNRLKVTLRVGVHRPLMNASDRGTPNLDGKRWSGFAIEPLAIESGEWNHKGEDVIRHLEALSTNLSVESLGKLRRENSYYPDADLVAHRKTGFSVELKRPLKPRQKNESGQNGRIVEFDAEDVLRACHVGLISDGRLEILTEQLTARLNKDYETWHGSDIEIEDADPEQLISAEKVTDKLESPGYKADTERAYTMVDHAPDSHTHQRTVFTSGRTLDGLAVNLDAYEVEACYAKYMSLNTAVCLPLSNDPDRHEPLVGLEQRRLPIPNRLEGKSVTTQLPSFRLPAYITNLSEARVYLAEQFGCKADDVEAIGSSFFLYPEISPERVFPFVINNVGSGGKVEWHYARPNLAKQFWQPVVKKATAVVLTKAMRELNYGHKVLMTLTPGSDLDDQTIDTFEINLNPSSATPHTQHKYTPSHE